MEKKLIPNHLGIILDGNRRWAKEKNLPVSEGHRKGLEKLKQAIEWCRKKGIKILTLFIFSTENWKRSKKEVNHLMKLIAQAFNKKNIKKIAKEDVKICVIGQKERLSKKLSTSIKEVEALTKANKGMVLNFALSYGGRTEIIEAIKSIVKSGISPGRITEKTVKKNLWTSDVDLIIRTGKEQRISNFLIWQAAYSELYFCQKFWPDFSEGDLEKAIQTYSNKQRRFGK